MPNQENSDPRSSLRKTIEFPLRVTGIDGLLHSFSFWNLHSGRNTLGDRIMHWTMYKPGPVDFPVQFATMFTAEALAEAVFLGYGIYEAYGGNYDYLLANAALKIGLRIPSAFSKIFLNEREYF